MTSPSEFAVGVDGVETTGRVYAAAGPSVNAALILGHGAGADQRSGFMVDFARALAALGLDVVTFNFLYMEQGRRIPDRAPALEACYAAVIAAVRERLESARRHLFIGGKSMGGRIATQVAAADPCAPIAGLVLLGYPLHPPGRPDKPRDKHLAAIGRPMLVVQGSRDAFGMPAELAPVLDTLSPRPLMYVVSGGDHSFKITRRNPFEQTAVYDDIQRTIVEWIDGVCARQQR
ncbi:MAG TPA: alpha/beta fold hydrolase [Vicinamibacterales bacterium]|nr:alpha/beta fold hydrolase [Vicinamibacterales bacterium]